jgi:hypothetical protein
MGALGGGTLTITAHETAHPSIPNATQSTSRYWTIAAAGVSSVDTLQFHYLSSDIQGNEANYVPMRYTGTGTSWELGSSTNTVNSTFHYVTAVSPTVLSADWTVGESSLTPVERVTSPIPLVFYVNQNYPNPFNPTTSITFGLPKHSYVSVKVYSILGQEVATLFAGDRAAGVHTFKFDASNLSSGIYLYRVQAGNAVDTKRMVLIK